MRNHLKKLEWDKVSRVETWLIDYLDCTDSEFIRAVSSRWLISAVARIFRPGCQADHVLLLEGPQGIRKSSALRALVGDEWFADHIADLGSKDSRLDLLGKWVIEMSELGSMRRAEIEKVKAFLTARTDHFRPPLDAAPSTSPDRTCSLRPRTKNSHLWTQAEIAGFGRCAVDRLMWMAFVAIVINFGQRLSPLQAG